MAHEPIAYERALSVDLTVEKKGARWSYDMNVLGVTTEALALDYATSLAPPMVQAENFELYVSRRRVKQIGPDAFIVSLDYEPLDEDDDKNQKQPDAGFWKFSWNTAGGTQKVTTALEAKSRYQLDPASPAPDIKGVIGWQPNGLSSKVTGTDIVVPKLEFSITRYYAPNQVTMELVKNLARATGKTNKAAWLGFDTGELLFLGSRGDADIATVRNQRTKPISAQLDFAASENIASMSVGGITGIAKKGWEALSVVFMQKADNTIATKPVVPVPIYAYVDRVYNEMDYATIFGFG